MEMRPFVAGLGAIVATTLVLARSARRGGGAAIGCSGLGNNPFERSEQ